MTDDKWKMENESDSHFLACPLPLKYHLAVIFELVFPNTKEGKIHESFRDRSAQAATYG